MLADARCFKPYSPRLCTLDAQGGRAGAAAYAKKHLLAGQTLEMLGDMRSQFASMLADAHFVAPPAGGRGRGSNPKGSSWADDPAAAWNRHALQPAVVRLLSVEAHVLSQGM